MSTRLDRIARRLRCFWRWPLGHKEVWLDWSYGRCRYVHRCHACDAVVGGPEYPCGE